MDVIGIVLAVAGIGVAVVVAVIAARRSKAFEARRLELEERLASLESGKKSADRRLGEMTRRTRKLEDDLNLAIARRDEKAISGAMWELELERIERRWRDVVVPSAAPEPATGKSTGQRLAFAITCEVERLREEVGVSIRCSGDVDVELQPEIALGALRVTEEWLAHASKHADEISVDLDQAEEPSVVVTFTCDGWDGSGEADVAELADSHLATKMRAMTERLGGWVRFERGAGALVKVALHLPAGTAKLMTTIATIEITTPAFGDHEPIPETHSRGGGNASPALKWSGVPSGTVELALTCEDRDAGGGKVVHWLVAGIDPSVGHVDEGVAPKSSVEGKNDFGEVGFTGPSVVAASEPHRYFFRVHACSKPLQLSDGFSNDALERALAESEIASGAVVGTYHSG